MNTIGTSPLYNRPILKLLGEAIVQKDVSELLTIPRSLVDRFKT